jgi:hypothetical protein
MKTEYVEAPNGSNSSTRLIGFIVVMAALILAQEVVYFGKDNPVTAATTAGTIFITIAGPVLTFLFKQKQTENQSQMKYNKFSIILLKLLQRIAIKLHSNYTMFV